jgi:hypothetical protein
VTNPPQRVIQQQRMHLTDGKLEYVEKSSAFLTQTVSEVESKKKDVCCALPQVKGIMTKPASQDENRTQSATLQSQDVVAGLGLAPRDLLATCVALFEDSTLQQRLGERLESLKKMLPGSEPQSQADQATVSSLQQRRMQWSKSSLPDDELRLILWMRLREAMDLAPETFGAMRSARTAADDLVAATLASVQPGLTEKAKDFVGWGTKREVPDSLDTLSRMTMAELVANVMENDDPGNAQARDALMQDLKKRVSELDQESQTKLLNAVNARELNDDAIRTLLLTGGGLATFGGAVSIAGFSAYILAAQASAFIPLISGPALVSLVSVLSNPITIVLATLGAGVWATRSANQKIQSAIAMRVVALMALNGIAAGDAGLRRMTQAFGLLPKMRKAGALDLKILVSYQADWAKIQSAHAGASKLDAGLAAVMDRDASAKGSPDRLDRLLHKDDVALPDMAAMGALTLGELLYNIHALDSDVLKAADFSRVEDLGDPTTFAAFAHKIDTLAENNHLGAISNLKGYVAEQVVASQLIQQGHVVTFPEISNEAGWDLDVDGVKFQIKNAADLSLLERHFDQYDYPILANSEVADQLARAAEHGKLPSWADHVHFVEGYSQAGVQHVTDQTLDAGDGMLHPHVPSFAVLLTAVRGMDRYRKGQVSGSQAIQDVVVNGTVRATLAVAGNYAGVAIGLVVFGPAGALVLGSVLPILSRTQSARAKGMAAHLLRGSGHATWEKDARQAWNTLVEALQKGLKNKRERIKARTWSAQNAAADYLAWRQDDDLRFLREVTLRLDSMVSDQTLSIDNAAEQLLVWISTSTLHPAVYQTELEGFLKVFEKKPSIGQNLGEKTEELAVIVTGFWAGVKHAYKKNRSGKGDT